MAALAVEQGGKELHGFERAISFIIGHGCVPGDDDLEQLRLYEELERERERERRLYRKRREKKERCARNKQAKLLSKFGLPCWLFGSDPDDPCADPSCLDEQDGSDTEAGPDYPGYQSVIVQTPRSHSISHNMDYDLSQGSTNLQDSQKLWTVWDSFWQLQFLGEATAGSLGEAPPNRPPATSNTYSRSS
uniref:Uncharacterized protein n=1 Tax=Leersia perrieri TaxID=77586 RepID=A0A0D9V2H7_9ORYZ